MPTHFAPFCTSIQEAVQNLKPPAWWAGLSNGHSVWACAQGTCMVGGPSKKQMNKMTRILLSY